jgi:DNA-binding NtrC family response regulator
MAKGVMVVDDEDEMRDALCHHFTRNGLEAVAASGGRQCLEHFKNGFSGVVLMDVHMPDMDGWAAIAEIIKRGYGQNAVILLLTGDRGTRTDNLQEFRKYVAEYIPKPVDLKQLVTSVKNYLKYFE